MHKIQPVYRHVRKMIIHRKKIQIWTVDGKGLDNAQRNMNKLQDRRCRQEKIDKKTTGFKIQRELARPWASG